jgi:hypothetical protein
MAVQIEVFQSKTPFIGIVFFRQKQKKVLHGVCKNSQISTGVASLPLSTNC